MAAFPSGIGNFLGEAWGALQGTANTSSQQQYAISLANYSPQWGIVPPVASFGDESTPRRKEGEIETALQWLDRRVNEMRVRL